MHRGKIGWLFPVIIVVLLLFAHGCSDDGSNDPVTPGINSFGFAATDNSGLSVDVNGIVDGTNIIIILPAGTDRSALIANFRYSGKSITVGGTGQISGNTTNNHTGTVVYTITGDNPTNITYSVKALSWESLGTVSDTAGLLPAVSIDSNNCPVVSYNLSNTQNIYAKKWTSGTSWNDLGGLNTTGGKQSDVLIRPDNNDAVFLYKDFGSLKIQEWDGSSWTQPLSGGSLLMNADYFQFKYNPLDNKYWFVLEQYQTNDRTQVNRIEDSTTWTNMGFLGDGGSRYNSLAIDENGRVVVVFCEQTNGTNVMAYRLENETNWISFGSVSDGPGAYSRVELDINDYLPFVVYADLNNGGSARAKKWHSGTIWTDLGTIGSGTAIDIRTAVDPYDGRYLVSYQDANGKIQVYRWGGETVWNNLSFPHSGTNAVIACGNDGLPVVALSDAANAGKITVYKLK